MAVSEIIDPRFAPMLLFEGTVIQYFAVAITTVIVYHSVLRLDKEVEYFWFRKFNTVNAIYFMNKYAGLLGAICNIIYDGLDQSVESCLITYWLNSLANLANVILIDYILMLRVLALYERDRRIVICLQFLLVLEAITLLGLLLYAGILDKVFVGDLPGGLAMCFAEFNSPASLDSVSWAIPMVHGLILLTLSLRKVSEYRKMSSSLRAFPLVKVLIEDQIIYYIFIISCCVLRIITILHGSIPFVIVFINAAGNPTFLSVLGSHLLIRLKEASERSANGGASQGAQIVSDIVFTQD